MCVWVESISPETIASDREKCLRFFDISNVHYICVDEIHSQGKDCFAFGSRCYCLRNIERLRFIALKEELIEKGAIISDSIVSLRRQRDSIEGNLKLFLAEDAPYQVVINFKEKK